MQESLGVKGDSAYKLPHMGEEKLSREGELPIPSRCDPAVIATTRKALDERDEEVPSTPATAPTTTGGLYYYWWWFEY